MSSRERYQTPPNAPGYPGNQTQAELNKIDRRVTALESGGVSNFTDLGDVPASYSGQANKLVGVNAGATGLEFTNTVRTPVTLESSTTPQLIIQPSSGTLSHLDMRTGGFHFIGVRWELDSTTSFFNWYGFNAVNRVFGLHYFAPANSLVIGINGNVGFNQAAPSAAAQVQIDSTTRGFLQPRMTDAQMLAISSPPEGLSVWNTTTKCLWTYDGTFWLPSAQAGSRLVHDIVDDFPNSSTVSNSVGTQGWNLSNGISGPVPSTQHHPGVYSRNANANITLCRTQLYGGSSAHQMVHSAQLRYWCFVAYVTQTGNLSNAKYSCGFYNDQAAEPNAGDNAIEFVCDGYGSGHTNWYARVRDGATTSLNNTGVAWANNTWVRFEIFKTSTSIKFYIDGVLVHTETTVLPSAMMYAGFKTIRDVTATPGFQADFWRHVSIHTR